MKKSYLYAATIGLSLAAPATSAKEPLRVDITQGTSSALPISVADVKGGIIAGTADGKDLGIALAGIVRANLAGTGLYRIIPVSGDVSFAPNFSTAPWRSAGVQTMVAGRVALSAQGILTYNCVAYDVFSAQTLVSKVITLPVAQWRRAAHQCADVVFEETTGDPGHFDTRIAFVSETGGKVGRTKRLAIMDQDGANVSHLTRGVELVATPRFAPDAVTIAYIGYVNRQPRLMIYDLLTGKSRMVNVPKGLVFAPRYSPNGKTIAFSLGNGGDTDIYKVDVATNVVTRLTATTGIDTSPSFSPDGTQIVFESNRSGSQQLYVMAADGSRQSRITFGGGRYASPVWSPRGDLIAYTKIGGGEFAVGTIKVDGSRERVLTRGWQDESPSWSLNGRNIVFLRTQPGDTLPELWTTDVSGRVQQQIKLTTGGADPSWSGARP